MSNVGHNPVHGTTGTHTTAGAKLDSAVGKMESAVHGATHPGATHTGPLGTGAGAHTGTHTHHTVQNPATGEVHHHTTKVGAKLDEAWQNTKTAVPGTKEHSATHPTSTGAATGPGTFPKY